MLGRKVQVEIQHEFSFCIPISFIEQHVRIQVMNHPVLRDRHVGCKGFSIDDHNPILTIHPILASIVDKRGDKILIAILRF